MEKSNKSRLILVLLTLFLGGIGVHRFYAGKLGTGILQLLLTLSFFGLPIVGLWVFIDFLVGALGGFRDGDRRLIAAW